MKNLGLNSRAGVLFFGVTGLCGALLLAACGDDDDATTPTDAGPDTSIPTDSGPQDTGTPEEDSGNDAGTDAASDADSAAPEVTKTTSGFGEIYVDDMSLAANFYGTGTILKTTNCEAHIFNITELLISAGNISLTGGLIGNAAGNGPATTPLSIAPGDDPKQYFYFDDVNGTVLYDPSATNATFSLTSAGGTFPAITPAVSFKAPKTTPTVAVLTPTVPGGGASLTIAKNADYNFTWTAPAAGLAEQVILALQNAQTTTKQLSVFCSFPSNAGAGKIPAALLASVLTELGVTELDGNTMTISGGEQKISTLATGQHVVTVGWSTVAGSSFAAGTLADIK